MLTLIAASLAAAPTPQPAPVTAHAQHAQHAQHQQQGSGQQPHQMPKMEGCCCCKDMAGKHDGEAMAPKAENHKGH